MRPTTRRLLAAVKPVAARYLEPGAPTGLTGLHAAASPRATLLFLYRATLDKLAPIPATSVYRQSVEAVTKLRLAAVEAVQPEGLAAWKARAAARLKEYADLSDAAAWQLNDGSLAAKVEVNGRSFVVRTSQPEVDERHREWDGAPESPPLLEVPRTADGKVAEMDLEKMFTDKDLEWEDEPKLTIAQVEELENKIGAGLIEEVIKVAEGELALVDTMVQSKAWESLDEKPAAGQWVYFDRKV